MKELNDYEINQVSGGFIALIFLLNPHPVPAWQYKV